MASVRVQHCLVNRTTRQYGPHPTSDLLGVDYFLELPADTEFPRLLGKMEVFVRFFVAGDYRKPFQVSVSRLHADGTDREVVYSRTVVLPLPTSAGTVVFDVGVKLVNVLIPGEGTYAVRVSRRVRRGWEGTPRWRVLATDFVNIARAT